MILLMIASCGKFDVRGGTNNKVEGETIHRVIIEIDPKMCKQEDGSTDNECLTSFLEMISNIITKGEEVVK
jgi:hypothetical protein